MPAPDRRKWKAQIAEKIGTSQVHVGRLIASIVPERTANIVDSRAPESRWCDIYTYDDRGNLTSHTDPRGIVARYNYLNDPLDRLHGITSMSTRETSDEYRARSLVIAPARPMSVPRGTRTTQSRAASRPR